MRVILLIGAIFLGGCAARYAGPVPSCPSARLEAESIIGRYGEVRDPFVQSYLNYLRGRLVMSLPPDSPDPSLAVALVRAGEPFAVTTGAGKLIVSSGLVHVLRNEAELAFVIAHEFSHQYLNHAEAKCREETPVFSERDLDTEVEADRFALGLVAVAGYDPRAAVGALAHDFGRYGAPPEIVTELHTRLRTLEERIVASGWHPPGTVDRREFRKLILSLN